MKGRLVFYENYQASAISKSERYDRALQWVKSQIVSSQPPETSLGLSEEEISVTGRTEIDLPQVRGRDDLSSPHYEIEFRLTITVTNDGQRIEIFNFYEKPSYPGVTHDFSKIEYRWRDFVKGKPWYKDDKTLFIGLDKKMQQLTKSFQVSFK